MARSTAKGWPFNLSAMFNPIAQNLYLAVILQRVAALCLRRQGSRHAVKFCGQLEKHILCCFGRTRAARIMESLTHTQKRGEYLTLGSADFAFNASTCKAKALHDCVTASGAPCEAPTCQM